MFVVLGILVVLRALGFIGGIPLLSPELKWLLIGERLAEGFEMYSETFDYTGPLSAVTYKLLDLIAGRSRWIHWVASTLTIVVQAGILNIILLRNQAFSDNNYFPALFYVLAAFAISDSYALSPQLMSLTFILLSLNNIFRRIDNEATDELFLFAGLYLGIAALFYLPAVVYFVFLLVSLLLFTSPALRRLILFFYGLLLPVLLTFCYFYWFDAHWAFFDSYFARGFLAAKSYAIGGIDFLISSSLFMTWLLISLWLIFRKGKFANYQAKIQQVMGMLMIAAVTVLWVDVEFGPYHLFLFVPSVSFFLTQFILLLEKRIFQLVVPYLIVLTFALTPFILRQFAVNEKIEMEPYEMKNVKERARVMSFDQELAIYQNYAIATPFIDRQLSQQWLGRLDYFQSATHLYEVIKASDPDVIVGEGPVISKLFDRFEPLKSEFKRNGDHLERIP